MIDEDSDDQTHNNVLGENTFVNNDDTTNTFEAPPKTSKPITSTIVPNNLTPLSTPPEFDVFENILNESIINLSHTPPPPPPISTSFPIESTIAPLVISVSEPTYLSQTFFSRGVFR